MERIIAAKRETCRRRFDEQSARLLAAITAKNQLEIEQAFVNLRDKSDALLDLNAQIQSGMLESSTEEIATEMSEAENYNEKYLDMKTAYDAYHKQSTSIVNSVGPSKGCIKLPKQTLVEFDGEVKHWLGFWSQFKSIHEDERISPVTKFSYLRQAMTPGSPAAELVNSYVQSEDSYPKVIEHLKSRFARDGLLIETYMRELLALVMQNYRGQTLDLREMYDKLETQLRALESLGISSNKYAAMLKPLVESALPEDILQAWQRSRIHFVARGNTENREGEELEALLKFLGVEVEGEQQRKMAKEAFGLGTKDTQYTAASLHVGARPRKNEPQSSASGTTKGKESRGSKISCVWCDLKHSSSECFQVRNWPFADRLEHLRKKQACFTCLRTGDHRSADCKLRVKCIVCAGKHYTIMCSKVCSSKATAAPSQPITTCSEKKNSDTGDTTGEGGTVLLAQESGPTVLQTLRAKIVSDGPERVVRILLDSGSQRSYITTRLAEESQLERRGVERLSHCLFGGVETTSKVHNKYKVVLQSLSSTTKVKFSALSQDRICNGVPRLVEKQIIQRLAAMDIILTDIGPDPPPIDILLGADVIASVMTGVTMHVDQLIAVQTNLGWTIMGPTFRDKSQSPVVALSLTNTKFDLQDMWKLEVLGIRDLEDHKKNADWEAEMNKLLDVHVNEEGRYEVALPWKGRTPTLVCNRQAAETRLLSTTRKLLRSGKFIDYGKVFLEWADLGIIETVPDIEDKDEGFYLPHRAVIKETSETTKIRPDFDASAKDYNGISLNLGLEKGPNMIEDTLKLLIDFRKGAIGVTADIAKAFLQISIIPADRRYLKFLWWEGEPMKKMMVYRHKRVVFGVTSSPFLLNATIEYHLSTVPEEYTGIARQLQGKFYMDNVVTSVESKEDLIQFSEQARRVMNLGKFDLRQWASGPVFIEHIPLPAPPVSILGVHWDRENDELFVDRTPKANLEGLTRRSLLSMAHSYFDPLGLICPYTLLPRLFLQESWAENGGWDDELSESLARKVRSWMTGAELILQCRMSRRLTAGRWNIQQVSLHVFSDASKRAYAACIFLREESQPKASVRLVQGKARVAPIKPSASVPRLELMAALIGVRLCEGVKKAMGAPDVIKAYYWTDSKVVRHWIQCSSGSWSVFVRNRCAEINKYTTSDQWRYVPGPLNPADLPSRGCGAKALLDSRWWEGPEWLRDSEETWPRGSEVLVEAEQLEAEEEVIKTKARVLMQVNQKEGLESLVEGKTFTQILKVVARIVRWRSRQKGQRDSPVTSEELREAERRIFQMVQRGFRGGIKFTKEFETFVDEQHYVRLKTRLIFGDEPEDFKTPILLPGESRIVQAYVREQHYVLKHAGVSIMMANLRERFWITGIRRVVKRVIQNCMQCKRQIVRALETPSAPLPKERIKLGAVFESVGVDYAGPLYLAGGGKAWIVLFTCAVYRAVHLEVAESLSTSEFFAVFRRFVARRGRPSTVFSDNGTQFKGAAQALKAIDWETITAHPETRSVTWIFTPPSAPWWGGFWERLIGMVKQLLRRNLGRATLKYSELVTVVCEVEGIIKRPLTYIGDEELKPLTPEDFLHSLPSSGVEDLDHLVRTGLNNRLKYLLKLREGLRQRFRSEYLALLVNRLNRTPHVIPIQPGDVVLIEDDSKKRLDWPLGRVLEVMPGLDGKVRVARLRVAGRREIVRPLRRLFPFAVEATEDTPEEGKKKLEKQQEPTICQPVVKQGEERTSRKSRRIRRKPARYQP